MQVCPVDAPLVFFDVTLFCCSDSCVSLLVLTDASLAARSLRQTENTGGESVATAQAAALALAEGDTEAVAQALASAEASGDGGDAAATALAQAAAEGSGEAVAEAVASASAKGNHEIRLF
jgi:hypothetical protein